jgi:hypothetical protein
MPKLIVCGASISADSVDYPGTGYGHRTAQRLGWDVEILARPGCSNGAIRIQIDEVLRQRPDFAIITPTFSDRIEIPVNTVPYDWIQDPNLPDYLRQEVPNGYIKEAGIDNVNYGSNPYRMICETIVTLAENRDNPYRVGKVDKNTQAAIKQYINHLYDAGWKRQQDEWIMRDGIMQLFYAGIPFLVVATDLWNTGNIRQAIPQVVNDRYLTMADHETPYYAVNKWPFKGTDPGYHGSPASQTYLAEIYYGKICEILATCRLTDHK